MMRLPGFNYVAPPSLDEAAKMLAADPANTRLVAGGTDLWPNMKRRHQQAETVVGLRGIPGIQGVRGDGRGEVGVGAMTRLSEICRSDTLRRIHPGLVRAVATISTPVLRNMGTIGGNLCLDTRCTYYNQNEEWRRSIGYCLKECGETCWVAPGSDRCWAISATDSAPLLSAIGARVKLVSERGERVIPLTALYRDDGIEYLSKEADEILSELLLPPAGGFRATYWKLRRRGSIDFPVLGVGAALWRDETGGVIDARIFLGGVKSHPLKVPEASAVLIGGLPTAERIAEAARHARDRALPMDNTDYEMKWRRHMAELYVDGALRELAGLEPRLTLVGEGGAG